MGNFRRSYSRNRICNKIKSTNLLYRIKKHITRIKGKCMNLQKKEMLTETMSLEAYLTLAKKNPSIYDTPAQRMLKAIGTPVILDTSKAEDKRLSRIYGNRNIKTYEAFSDFYGLNDVIA